MRYRKGSIAFSEMYDLPTAASTIPHFANGASSTGWVDFEFQDGKRIFIPAKINGHETRILLATGLPVSNIDKTYAESTRSVRVLFACLASIFVPTEHREPRISLR